MLALMFYLSYLLSDLRRRKGRTLLTALSLGVGGAVGARAQPAPAGERAHALRPQLAGGAGGELTRTDFMSAAQLSFPASQVAKLAALDGVEDAAGSLTLSAVSISGTVPEGGLQRPARSRSRRRSGRRSTSTRSA